MSFGTLPPSRVCPPAKLLLHKLALTHAGPFQTSQKLELKLGPPRRSREKAMNSCCIGQFENVSWIAPKFLRHQVKNDLDKFGIRNTLHYTVSVYDIEWIKMRWAGGGGGRSTGGCIPRTVPFPVLAKTIFLTQVSARIFSGHSRILWSTLINVLFILISEEVIYPCTLARFSDAFDWFHAIWFLKK